jgi:hypothetical protein
MFVGRIGRHIEQLSKYPGPHGFCVQRGLPVAQLLGVAAAAGIRVECGFLRAEPGGYGALGFKRTRPVPVKKGFDRVVPAARRGRRRGLFAAPDQQAA